MMDDPFIEYIESRRTLVNRTIEQLEALCLDFKEELADLDAAMKVRLRMKERPAAASGLAAAVSSMTETAAPPPAPPKVASIPVPPASRAAPSAPKASPGRGPKLTNPNRPDGIPSNLDMCISVLQDAGKPLSGTEIRNHVARRWWPDIGKDWKSTPFGFLASGKLVKRGDLFDLPPAPAKASSSAAARPAGSRMFKHGGRAVDLPDKAWRVVTRLHAAMGQGLVEFKSLADDAFKGDGGRAISPQLWLDELAAKANPILAEIKLEMVCVAMMPKGPKAGYVLRELP